MKFSTALLDDLIQQKKIKQEEIRLKLIIKIFDVLNKLREQIPFKQAYLFGSVTKSYKFNECSDVDIGFVDLDDEFFFKAMTFIANEIERDVDIMQLENHRLKEKIEKEGLAWIKK